MKLLTLFIACFYLSASWAVAGFIINPYRYVVTGGGADPNFAQVVALLHFNGSDTSTTITDSSSAANTFSVSGNAQLTTTGPQFGSACLTLDGSGDDVYAADDADWNLGTGNWTIEGWAYPASASAAQTIIAQWGSGNAFFFGVGSGYGVYLNGSLIVSYTSWPAANTWTHWAFLRNGVNVSLWVNGTQVGSDVNIGSGAITDSSSSLRIGRDDSGANPYFSGKMDDIRITKTNRDPATFPPTVEHPDS